MSLSGFTLRINNLAHKLKLIKSNPWFERISLAIVSYLSILAMAQIANLYTDSSSVYGYSLFGYNIYAIVIYGVEIWLLHRFIHRNGSKSRLFGAVLGLLLSAACVYGAYAHVVNDIFINPTESVLQIFLVLGIGLFTIPLSEELYLCISRFSLLFQKERERENDRSLHPVRFFLFIWLAVFLAFIPVFLSEWPGNFIYDGRFQIRMTLSGSYSTHHPLIHTLLMGYFYKLGQSIGNVSAGYQFYTLIQMAGLSSAFSHFAAYLYRKKVPRVLLVCTVLWFALFPMNTFFAITSTKDVLCAAFFLHFMTFFLELFYDRQKFAWYPYVGMLLSGTLTVLFRNNMIYAIVIGCILCVFLLHGIREKAALLIMMILITASSTMINNGLIKFTNASSDDVYRESMCVPLQCLARVASYRYDDLDPTLYDEICMYIDPAKISEYNPYNADSVKNTANEELLASNTINFFKLWVKTGLQFPGEYFEAIITNTLGYWFPLNQGYYTTMEVSLYHTLIESEDEITKTCYCEPAKIIYRFLSSNFTKLPILGYFFRCTPYIWILVISILWTIVHGNRKGIIQCILPFMYLLTCLAGPIVAVRYIYPIIVCLPLFIFLILDQSSNKRTVSIAPQ